MHAAVMLILTMICLSGAGVLMCMSADRPVLLLIQGTCAIALVVIAAWQIKLLRQ